MKSQGILFVRKSNPQIGGVEMQMFRIAKWMKEKHQFPIFLATNDLEGNLAKLFMNEGMTVILCPLTGKFYLYNGVKKILDICRKHDIKFIQAHLFRESIVCRIVKMMRPSLIHFFRVETYIDCSQIDKIKKNSYHHLAKLTGKFVNHYFANGTLVSDELKNKSAVEESKISILYNGVEQSGKADKQVFQKDADGYFRIAMIANLIPGKGHELIFDAISQLRKSGIIILLSLFGDDMGIVVNNLSYKMNLLKYTEAVGISEQVQFKGFSNNLENDLQEIQVIILPSDSEGTPNAILEAMSLRKLVIVSDAGELPFLVINEKSGLIHKRKNLDDLIKQLLFAVSAPEKLIENIRDHAFLRWQELFSLNEMMFQLEKYYLEDDFK